MPKSIHKLNSLAYTELFICSAAEGSIKEGDGERPTGLGRKFHFLISFNIIVTSDLAAAELMWLSCI